MRTLSSSLRAALALGALVSLAAAAQPAEEEGKTDPKKKDTLSSLFTTGKPDPSKKGELKIDADSAELDFNSRNATFEGNVKVSDERMLLLADKMIVYLAEKNELSMIEAIGNVVISEVGKLRKANAGKAVFDVEKDEIVLTDNPTVDDPQWGVRSAEKIVYDRKNRKFRFLKLRFVVPIAEGSGGPRDLLTPSKKKEKEAPKS